MLSKDRSSQGISVHHVFLTVHHYWMQFSFCSMKLDKARTLCSIVVYPMSVFFSVHHIDEIEWETRQGTRQGSHRSISVHPSMSYWPSIMTGRKFSLFAMKLDKTGQNKDLRACSQIPILGWTGLACGGSPRCIILRAKYKVYLFQSAGPARGTPRLAEHRNFATVLTVPFLYTTACFLDHPSWLEADFLSAQWRWTRQDKSRQDRSGILLCHFCTPQCVFLTIHHYWEQVFFLWNGIGQDEDLTVPFLYTTVCLLDHPSLLGAGVLSAWWNYSL